MTTGRRPYGLATRVLTALVLVVLTGGLTAWLVASAVAPPLFAKHMHEAGHGATSQAAEHAEQAFRSANGISLAVALLAALAVSVAVSLYVTRRLARSLRPVSEAAADVARGRYGVQVERPGLGAEFDELTDAFNHMAAQLNQVEETRRRLLADLAHEVRTPVATLRAYVEALEDGVTTLDADTVAVMQAQIARLTRLAQDVTAVSRAEEGQRVLRHERSLPAELISAARAAAAERYAAKGVRLTDEVAPDLTAIEVDRDRMAQVFGNLLDNALRYTPAGGGVTITADQHQGRVRVHVTDTGEGIAPEHLPHVFERFYRADAARDRAHGGSGIGLAIVKALVEAHDGRVSVASVGLGHGATFTIELPTAGATAKAR